MGFENNNKQVARYSKNLEKFLCSSFVRDVLKHSGAASIDPWMTGATAGSFYNSTQKDLEKSHNIKLPFVSKKEAKPGDIIVAGLEGEMTSNSAHIGIYLGDGLYVSQSPKNNFDVQTNTENSSIRIRPSETIKGNHDSIRYRRLE